MHDTSMSTQVLIKRIWYNFPCAELFQRGTLPTFNQPLIDPKAGAWCWLRPPVERPRYGLLDPPEMRVSSARREKTYRSGRARDHSCAADCRRDPEHAPIAAGCHGRQGLRQRKSAPADQGRRCLADHPEPLHRPQESLLSQAHLSPPAQNRKLLLPHQGLAAYRHPLRQALPQLPRRYQARRSILLDQIVSPDPRTLSNACRGGPTYRVAGNRSVDHTYFYRVGGSDR
jgi:hypothetical protein